VNAPLGIQVLHVIKSSKLLDAHLIALDMAAVSRESVCATPDFKGYPAMKLCSCLQQGRADAQVLALGVEFV